MKPLTVSITALANDTATLESVQVRAEALTPAGWSALPQEAVTPPNFGSSAPVITPPLSSTANLLLGDVPEEAVAVRFTIIYSVAEDNYFGSAQHSVTDTLTVELAAAG